MSTTKATCIRRAMSTVSMKMVVIQPQRLLEPPEAGVVDVDEVEIEEHLQHVLPSRGLLKSLVFAEMMVHRASERAESDSDVGDNPADVKTSNSASEEDAEDTVTMRTPYN
ncbi:hypothetical protein V8D89_001498 [Ganoderma adspersum]